MDDQTNLIRISSRATRSLIADAFVAAGLPQADAGIASLRSP
jgi:hypothetical protein